MNVKIDHMPIDNYKRKGIKMKPTYITIHSTANPDSTAINERNWLTNSANKRQASWHYCVDETEIIEAIPPNEVAFHAGNEKGNYNSIGIEMCESGNREKVINDTIKFTRELMKKYNIPIENVVRHYDWTKKDCHRILNFDNCRGWKNFKSKLSAIDHWEEKYYKKGIINSIQTDMKRFNDNITRGEVFALLSRIINK